MPPKTGGLVNDSTYAQWKMSYEKKVPKKKFVISKKNAYAMRQIS